MGYRTRRRTKQQLAVMERIRDLFDRGAPLNISAIGRKHPDLLLEAYDIHPFWGWRRAMDAAGVDYASIAVELLDRVECRICGEKRRMLGQHIRSAHHMKPEQYRADHEGTEITAETVRAAHFSSRQNGARCLIPHWEPVWTGGYVLDRLAAMGDQEIPLNPMSIKEGEPRLYWAALTYHHNWDIALRRIGLDPAEVRLAQRRRRWTRELVVEELHQRLLNSKPLHYAAVAHTNTSLINASVRLFGTYDRALTAAGVDPGTVRRRPVDHGRDERRFHILDAIRERHRQGLRLNDNALTRGADEERDTALYSRARRMFGSWRQAVEASGLDYSASTSR